MSTSLVIQSTVTDGIDEVTRQFSYHDKCDHCGFQAYWAFERPRVTPLDEDDHWNDPDKQEIVLCKNRGDRSVHALELAGWIAHDYTFLLDEEDRLVGSDH